MSKSILIIEMPDNCRECPCHFTDMVTFSPKEGEKFFSNLCGVNNKGLKTKEMNNCRPDWCPLKEVPQKYYPVGMNFEYGWNACIDEILKGCDENE